MDNTFSVVAVVPLSIVHSAFVLFCLLTSAFCLFFAPLSIRPFPAMIRTPHEK